MIRSLAGLRVIETGSMLCVDLLGSALAAAGADVVKIESPGRGDYLRDMLGQITPHHSPAHVQANANKRSLTLDLRQQDGLEVFWRLLDTADVFITGNVGDACDRLGIGYDAQAARKPSIVFCQFTGFGASGPYSGIPTHGYQMNALGADWPMVADERGFLRVSRPVPLVPRKPPDATNMGAVWSALCVAAGVVAARRTGRGAFIDLAGADATIAGSALSDAYTLNAERLTDTSLLGGPLDEEGWPRTPRHGMYETSDGRVVFLGCAAARHWDRFCSAVGRPSELDPSSGDDAVEKEIAWLVAARPLSEWVRLAREWQFPCTPVSATIDQVRDDSHFRSRHIVMHDEHPIAGPFTYVGVPAAVAGQRFSVERPAPTLGEHTEELMAELGYMSDDCSTLRDKKVI